MSFLSVLRLFLEGKWKHFPVMMCPSLYHSLHMSCCQRKSIAPVKKTDFVSVSSDESLKDTGKRLEDLYSSEEKSAILQVLNTASVNELGAFTFLRGRKSINIVKHREKHGPFQDLESLMEVPLFQYKSTVKVCDSILHPESKEKKKEKKILENSLGKFVRLGIERKKLKAAKSIVSIVFGNERIAWAHLDNTVMVLDWRQENNFKLMKETYMPAMYLKMISSVVSKIPEADFYILEKRTFSLQQTTLFPVTLHFHIVEAMLYSLLNKTFAQDGQHRVLSMNRNVVGKHFDLMLGTMRTSGMALVQQFLSDFPKQEKPRVSFPLENLVRYRSMMETDGRKIKEELWDSLLQAVAFYELFMFDPQS